MKSVALSEELKGQDGTLPSYGRVGVDGTGSRMSDGEHFY